MRHWGDNDNGASDGDLPIVLLVLVTIGRRIHAALVALLGRRGGGPR